MLSLVLLAGCVTPPETPPTDNESDEPLVGGDKDEHGCIGSAGYTWCEPKQKCLREWEEPCEEAQPEEHMSEERAREIAGASVCTENGSLNDEADYNNTTKTWWIGLNIEKEGCAPACVVDEATETAEINWRCTGLIPPAEPEDSDDPVCQKEGTQFGMTLRSAKEAATGSLCTKDGATLTDNAMCNNVTGTWWIDLDMPTTNPGCSPACVINVETKLAEINWRCTGALPG